jgi:hypothetical protein
MGHANARQQPHLRRRKSAGTTIQRTRTRMRGARPRPRPRLRTTTRRMTMMTMTTMMTMMIRRRTIRTTRLRQGLAKRRRQPAPSDPAPQDPQPQSSPQKPPKASSRPSPGSRTRSRTRSRRQEAMRATTWSAPHRAFPAGRPTARKTRARRMIAAATRRIGSEVLGSWRLRSL